MRSAKVPLSPSSALQTIYVTGEAALQRIDLLPHRTRVGHDTPRPFKYAFTFGREALKSRAALHQQHAKRVLKLLDAGRQRGLTDIARFRRASKMLLAR